MIISLFPFRINFSFEIIAIIILYNNYYINNFQIFLAEILIEILVIVIEICKMQLTNYLSGL